MLAAALIVAVAFWRDLRVRTMAVTFAALLAFAVDLACRPRPQRPARRAAWARGIAVAAVAVAIVPIIPLPLQTAPVRAIPAGFQQAFHMLDLSPDQRVLIVPLVPSADMRWQADSNVTGALVGCYGIAPG